MLVKRAAFLLKLHAYHQEPSSTMVRPLALLIARLPRCSFSFLFLSLFLLLLLVFLLGRLLDKQRGWIK